jgi:benzylsuccinate CoA-transferase BbsE subunit
MADLEADVIVVEPPGGAPSRFRGPFYQGQPDREKSLYFWYFHTNKQSATLNLETPQGRDLFKFLVQTADVLVETFPPGELERLGLDYAHLRVLKPDLIMTSITNFGREGPYAHYQASDLIGLSMGGITYLCGEPDGPPVPPGGEQGYQLAALNGAMATLIALNLLMIFIALSMKTSCIKRCVILLDLPSSCVQAHHHVHLQDVPAC